MKRILLVEDSENDIELTLAALSDSGLANGIDIARDGEEAMDYFYCRGSFSSRTPILPAVVLLDLKLPKKDGLEVLIEMRSDRKLRAVPVVMLTSSREERDIISSYENGVNAYVIKPVSFPDFAEAIRKLGLFWAVLNEPPPLINGKID